MRRFLETSTPRGRMAGERERQVNCAAPEVERPGRPGEGVDPARWMEKVV